MRDAFQDIDLILRHQGKPAVFVEVFRAEGEQVMVLAEAVHEHITNVIVPSLPSASGSSSGTTTPRPISERADILRKSGALCR